MTGFIPAQRTKVIEMTSDVAEGAEPFRATIVTNLTFNEVDAIPLSGQWMDIFRSIAPYVLEWNAMGRNIETGEYEPLPAPAVAGPDVLQSVTFDVSQFLVLRIKTAHLGDPDEPGANPEASDDSPDEG